MTALTTERDTKQMSTNVDPALLSLPMAASTKIYAGAIMCDNNSGYAVPGSTALNLKVVGRAEETVDNSSGSAGALNVKVRRGVFRYANNGASLAIADRFSECYIVDDQTVDKTDGSGTRSRAGIVIDVDSDGVWVLIGAATDAQVTALETNKYRTYTRTFDHADTDVAVGASSAAINLGAALPAGAIVLAVIADNTQNWDEAGSETFTMDIGDGTDVDKFTPTILDIDGGVALLTQAVFVEGGGDQLTVTIAVSTVDLSTATTGTTEVKVLFVVPSDTAIAAP